ncbi:hypothetical protein [Flavobacterium sp. ZB4R12]|uniref:hypothetical protein n=1 Tax=Flavobacterium sp. ZB4R12 TaxID=3398732 RepID=UPI003AB00759
MKNKIKVTILGIMAVSFMQVFGQDRVNRQKITFDQKSEIMSKAIGWAYNTKLGEWVDYINVISNDKDYKDKYKNLQGAYMMSHTKQNLSTIQIKTITYNETKYFVLIIDKWNGRYKYPSIKEDWREFKVTIGYIFTKNEYDKLANIENILELKTKYLVNMDLEYEKYDEIKFLDLIQTELSKEKSEYSGEYKFPITKSKEGAIRFYMPDSFSSYSKYDFEKEYFETDYANFSKILIK